MKKFNEPYISVVKFNTEDILTKSSTYFAGGSDDNSYINEDNYVSETNPWM